VSLHGVKWRGKNLHDLDGWAALVVETRASLGSPSPAQFTRDLTARVRRISANWREDLSYQPNRPYHREAEGVIEAVAWLQARSRLL
jgi:hypothetical protein